MLHADTALESCSVQHLDQCAEYVFEVALAVDPALQVTEPVFSLAPGRAPPGRTRSGRSSLVAWHSALTWHWW